MAVAPYIPARDSTLDSWADNFATLITASPATYGLDATAALAIQNAFDTWHAAYLLGGSTGSPPVPVNPSTFTSVTVAAKNAEKTAMTILHRSYAAQIRINPGVASSDKIALGLNLPNNSPTPIGAPTTFPLLSIVSAGPGTQEIRYADSTTPSLRKKPAGTIGLQLFRGVAVDPIVDVKLCSFLDTLTVQPYQSVFLVGDDGKTATYFGRWVNRGRQAGGSASLVGPWSAGVSQTVAF